CRAGCRRPRDRHQPSRGDRRETQARRPIMMRFRTAALVVGIAMLVASTQAAAGIRATPEFESGETRPVSIAVLLAETTVVRQKVVDTEALVDESTRLAGVFAETLEGT